MNLDLDKSVQLAGGCVPLAAALGVHRQSIYNWQKQGFVPPARATQIEQLYGVDSVALIKPELRALVTSFASKR